MALTLAEIRAKLLDQAAKTPGSSNTGGGDKSIYTHWDIPEGTTAKLRFIPDTDPANPYFWVEKAMIKLPFAGIKGQADSKMVYVQVPCIEMWPDMGMCPILTEVRPWFKDKSLEEMGRKYWKKKSFIMHGFVNENPMKDDEQPPETARRFVMSPQIFTLVKAALMDPELENLPTDYTSGLDFIVKKTSKGGYADYTTSSWARKETALSAAQLETIESGAFKSLNDYMPKRPTPEDLVIMKEMFEASVDGQPYDADKWSKHYRPFGVPNPNAPSDSDKAAAPAPAATPAKPAPVKPAPVAAKPAKVEVPEDDIPFDGDDSVAESTPAVTPTAQGSRAEDIIAMIRNRQKKAE